MGGARLGRSLAGSLSRIPAHEIQSVEMPLCHGSVRGGHCVNKLLLLTQQSLFNTGRKIPQTTKLSSRNIITERLVTLWLAERRT